MSDKPLSLDEIEDELAMLFYSSQRPEEPAALLVPLMRTQQDFVLRWTVVITKTNPELAYQFASHAAAALKVMDEGGITEWILSALDVYDRKGLFPSSAVLQNASDFAARLQFKDVVVEFDDIAGVMAHFVQGLSGRPLKVAPSDEVYTDSDSLFLPPRLQQFSRQEDNFRLYKAMAAHQWAQTWYGSFRVDIEAVCAQYPDPERALELFHGLELVRLDAAIERDLSGLYREMQVLNQLADMPEPPGRWQAKVSALRETGASITDTVRLMSHLYNSDLPAPCCYQGSLSPRRVAQAMQARLEKEKALLQQALLRMQEGLEGAQAQQDNPLTPAKRRFGTQSEGAEADIDRPPELTLDGEPIVPPNDVQALLRSIYQDLGDIPDEYLYAAGDGDYRPDTSPQRPPEDVWRGTYHEEGAHLYNEWDHRRQDYRKNWCVLRELDIKPQDGPFVADTLVKYAGLVASLRKTFEALRGENRTLRRQKNGDEVDLDALVEALTDAQSGHELSERVFTQSHRVERDIAVLFMVDMSGSTKGWINEAERESLVLLCEALEILGDRYGIYGFSGMTRKRCELFRVKRFEEPYTDEVRARINGIEPQDYTRMGVSIRHLTGLLQAVEARTKLLITLSDGKPDDYDGYRGQYGIEDTRKALIEAKQAGVHSFCITIDSEARDYLPHMYGAVNYTVIDDVRRLPHRVADIYRRLTS
ncbi:MAG: nitric oxide reductase activation protein [Gammaproteobacteria bacterium]|nr:nitric oxide reductase activation protein [Gammaproteobacteria bacterium]